MKIYICWKEQEYFTSFEDVQDYYEQHYDCTTFNDFLSENYDSEDIFYFTEAERQSAIKDYRSSVADEVEDWIGYHCDVIEVEAGCKEK